MPWEESHDVLERVQRARRLLAEVEEHRGSADLQASVARARPLPTGLCSKMLVRGAVKE